MWEKNQNSFALAVHIMVAFPKIHIFIPVCIQRNLVRRLLINNFSNSLTQIIPSNTSSEIYIFILFRFRGPSYDVNTDKRVKDLSKEILISKQMI